MKEFFSFWIAAIKAAFSFGWAVFGILTTLAPMGITLLTKYFPSISKIHTFQWISEYQNEFQLALALVFGGFYLTYAPFLLFKKLKIELEETKKQLSSQLPKITLSSSITMSGRMENGPNNWCNFLVVILTIENKGQTTAVSGWQMTIFDKRKRQTIPPTMLNREIAPPDSQGRINIKYTPKDQIFWKLANNTIERGASVSGLLFYVIPEGTSEDAKFSIVCFDFNHKPTRMRFTYPKNAGLPKESLGVMGVGTPVMQNDKGG